MSVKSVGFAIGNLRARENRLLKAGDLNQLSAAKSTDELAKMLDLPSGMSANALLDALRILSSLEEFEEKAKTLQ